MALGGYLVLSVIWVLVCCFFQGSGCCRTHVECLFTCTREEGSGVPGCWRMVLITNDDRGVLSSVERESLDRV